MRVELCGYDAGWAEAFEEIRRRIQDSLGESARLIEHVGSTSIPGICAKPIIDVVLVVADSADESGYVRRLEENGFRFHLREPEWHEHRLFKLEVPPANVHVFSEGCVEVDRMLLFRNHLRADISARARYESAKQLLAQREWEKIQDYADGKSEIVETLLADARERRSEGI